MVVRGWGRGTGFHPAGVELQVRPLLPLVPTGGAPYCTLKSVCKGRIHVKCSRRDKTVIKTRAARAQAAFDRDFRRHLPSCPRAATSTSPSATWWPRLHVPAVARIHGSSLPGARSIDDTFDAHCPATVRAPGSRPFSQDGLRGRRSKRVILCLLLMCIFPGNEIISAPCGRRDARLT